MTKYREILRLHSMNLSQVNIAASCGVSKKTVNKVLKAAREHGVSWPIDDAMTDASLEEKLFPKTPKVSPTKQMPDFNYIRKELLKNGVNKKLLWTEYLETCRQSGGEPPDVLPVLLLHPAGRTAASCHHAHCPQTGRTD